MSSILTTLTSMVSILSIILYMPLYGLTYGLDIISSGSENESSKVNVVGAGAYFRSQGITSDNENVYFSSKTTLIKTKSDCRTTVNCNLSAIPDELEENYGIKHIGGISYYNGKIYAGMEDSKVWKYPMIGVFDAETLQFEKYYIIDEKEMTDEGEKLLVSRGMPWVAVDGETGYLYCMDHSKKPTRILCFDVNNEMKHIDTVPISECVASIQGAEFYDGYMYAATNDDTQAIYKIDVSTGNVEKFLDRNLFGGEGEGMTFFTGNGKTELLAMDMGTIFINAFVRKYEMN